MMNFLEFEEAVKEKIKERMDKSFVIEIQKIRKNNDVVLHGLTIRDPGSNLVPTIYLESFFEYYQRGVSMEEVVDKISTVYAESMPEEQVNMDFFKDFEKVKGRVTYRLVNAKKNEELLKDVPHIPFHDLAICFTYAFWSPELGDGMVLIHNNHMESWGSTTEELMQLAEKNTPELFPSSFYGVFEMLRQMGVEMELEENTEESLYVLSNQERTYGAAVILYPEILDLVAEKMQGDYYIIPSSVHEVLIKKATPERSLEEIKSMIGDINETQLQPEEVLSNEMYIYDSSAKKLSIAKVQDMMQEQDPKQVKGDVEGDTLTIGLDEWTKEGFLSDPEQGLAEGLMTFQEFKETVISDIRNYLPNDFEGQISIEAVKRYDLPPNDELIIRQNGSKFAPYINLKPYYDFHKARMGMEDILRSIVSTYRAEIRHAQEYAQHAVTEECAEAASEMTESPENEGQNLGMEQSL